MAFITGGDDAEKVSVILRKLANSLTLFDKGVVELKKSIDKKVDAFSAPIKRAQDVKTAVDKVKKSILDYKKETDAIKGKFMAMGKSVPTKVLNDLKDKMNQSMREFTNLGVANISLQHEINILAASTSHLGNNFNKAIDGLDRLNSQQDTTIKKGVGITGNFYQSMSTAIAKIPAIGSAASGIADVIMESYQQISNLVGEMNAFDMPSFAGLSKDVEMFASKLSIAPQEMIKAYAMNRDLLVKLSPEMGTMNDVFRNTNKIITQDVESINGSLRDFANDMSRTPAEAFQNVIAVSNIMKNAGLDLQKDFHTNAGELMKDMRDLSKLNGMEYNAMTKLYEQHVNSTEFQEYMLTIDEKERSAKLKDIKVYAEAARANGILTEDFLKLQRDLMSNQREQTAMDRFVEARRSEVILSMYLGQEKANKIGQYLTATQEEAQQMLATDIELQEGLLEYNRLAKEARDGIGNIADDMKLRMVTPAIAQAASLLTKASVQALGLTEQQAEMIKQNKDLQGFEDEALAAKKAYDEKIAGFFQDPTWALNLGIQVGEVAARGFGILMDLYESVKSGFEWLMSVPFFGASIEDKQKMATKKGMVYDTREKEEISVEEAKKRIAEMERSGTYAGRGISSDDMEFYGKKITDDILKAEKVAEEKAAKKEEMFAIPMVDDLKEMKELRKGMEGTDKKLKEETNKKMGVPPPISLPAAAAKTPTLPPISKMEEKEAPVSSPEDPIAKAASATSAGLAEVNKKLNDNNALASKQLENLNKALQMQEEQNQWVKDNTKSKFKKRYVGEGYA